MIVEPVQSEGGDEHATKDFFRELQAICKESDVCFIVDEVQTGVGVTGKMWAHEHWGLDESPDVVTFSKKALTGGFFFKDAFKMDAGYRIFNTWMGDAAKLLQFGVVAQVIEEQSLVAKADAAGSVLMGILKEGEQRSKGKITNLRGMGTLCAFDCAEGGQWRNELHS